MVTIQIQTAPLQNQQPFKLLIHNPSPRLIPVFETKITLLNQKYDIFRVKFNYDEQDAYETGRQFFLDNKEYTHFAILPDDLLVETYQVDKLVDDLIAHPDIQVLSGICNFSLVNLKFFNTVAIIPAERYYAYPMFRSIAKYEYTSLLQRSEYREMPKKGLKKVLFASFPFTIISRNVLQKFGFRPFEPVGLIRDGMGLDTLFYNNCLRDGVTCWADLDVDMLHIKDIHLNDDMTPWITISHENNIHTRLVKSPKYKQENILLQAGSNL